MLLVSVTEVALAESVYKVKLSVPHTTVCLGLNNDAPLNCRGGCYFWLDPKVTKRSSPQKCFFALLQRSMDRPLPQNRGKPWAAIIFRGSFVFHWPSRLLRSFAGLPYRFNTPYAKTCYALAHHTALPVFPGFFPKLFCGRSSSPFFAGKATELRCVCIVGAQTMTKIAMNHEPQTINNPIFVVNS